MDTQERERGRDTVRASSDRHGILQNVLDMAEKLGDKAAMGREQIHERLAQFVRHWEDLQELAKVR